MLHALILYAVDTRDELRKSVAEHFTKFQRPLGILPEGGLTNGQRGAIADLPTLTPDGRPDDVQTLCLYPRSPGAAHRYALRERLAS